MLRPTSFSPSPRPSLPACVPSTAYLLLQGHGRAAGGAAVLQQAPRHRRAGEGVVVVNHQISRMNTRTHTHAPTPTRTLLTMAGARRGQGAAARHSLAVDRPGLRAADPLKVSGGGGGGGRLYHPTSGGVVSTRPGREQSSASPQLPLVPLRVLLDQPQPCLKRHRLSRHTCKPPLARDIFTRGSWSLHAEFGEMKPYPFRRKRYDTCVSHRPCGRTFVVCGFFLFFCVSELFFCFRVYSRINQHHPIPTD